MVKLLTIVLSIPVAIISYLAVFISLLFSEVYLPESGEQAPDVVTDELSYCING